MEQFNPNNPKHMKELERYKNKNEKKALRKMRKEKPKSNTTVSDEFLDKFYIVIWVGWVIVGILGVLVICGVLWDMPILYSTYFTLPLLFLSILCGILQFKYNSTNKQHTKEKLHNQGFSFDKEIQVDKYTFLMDSRLKKWLVMTKAETGKIYDYSKILSYEIYEDGNSVVKGSAGRALIGGAFFGITGAIIGSSGKREVKNNCTTLKLLIRLNDIDMPLIELHVIKSETSKNGLLYKEYLKKLQEICACLEYMINNKTIEESVKLSMDNVEEKDAIQTKTKKEQLVELKELLDDGLITEEDYDKKKQAILND